MTNSLCRAAIILRFTCALPPCAHSIVGQPGTLDPIQAAGSPLGAGNTWPLIRDYLVTQCGMSLVQ